MNLFDFMQGDIEYVSTLAKRTPSGEYVSGDLGVYPPFEITADKCVVTANRCTGNLSYCNADEILWETTVVVSNGQGASPDGPVLCLGLTDGTYQVPLPYSLTNNPANSMKRHLLVITPDMVVTQNEAEMLARDVLKDAPDFYKNEKDVIVAALRYAQSIKQLL